MDPFLSFWSWYSITAIKPQLRHKQNQNNVKVGKGLAGEMVQQLRAGPGFGSQNSHSGLQLSVTTIPGDLTFSSGLLTFKQTLRHVFLSWRGTCLEERVQWEQKGDENNWR